MFTFSLFGKCGFCISAIDGEMSRPSMTWMAGQINFVDPCFIDSLMRGTRSLAMLWVLLRARRQHIMNHQSWRSRRPMELREVQNIRVVAKLGCNCGGGVHKQTTQDAGTSWMGFPRQSHLETRRGICFTRCLSARDLRFSC